MKWRRPVVFLLTPASLVALLWLGIANPLNLFVPRSARFSQDRFRSIKPGTPIIEAIKLLGEPIKTVREDRFDPSCPACVSYCFMGEPPSWVVSFQEAWLVADQQGRIVRVFVNAEP